MTGQRSNQLNYVPNRGMNGLAEVFRETCVFRGMVISDPGDRDHDSGMIVISVP